MHARYVLIYHIILGIIGSYSGPYFPAFGLNTERNSASLRMHSKCGKTRAKITPNTHTFHAVTYKRTIFWLQGQFSYSRLFV